MITGATRGAGGRKLANHLLDVRGHNVRTETGSTRGLGSADLRSALRELDAGAAGGRTERHAYHLHMDPGPTEAWTDDTWREAWERLETEMGLEDAAFAEVRHVTWRDLGTGEDLDRVRVIHGAVAVREREGGHQVLMAHVHRVYDLCRDDGSVVDTAHDFARREKVARVLEFDHGFDLVAGRHNRAVVARLDAERPEVATAIRSAGLCDRPRPAAPTTPRERAQAERTCIDPRDVTAAALSAWRASDDGASFRAALAGQGLRLAQGDRAVLLVDASGNVHALARVLGKASKADGDRIPARDVAARVAGLALRSTADARPTLADAPPLPLPWAETLPETVLPIPQDTTEHMGADPTHQGEQHGQTPGPPEEPSPDSVLGAVPVASADLDGQQRLGADQRDDAGRDDPGQPPVAGRARDGSGLLRGVEDGAADSRPDAVARPVATIGGGGADPDQPGPGAPGGDGGRDRADRAAAGRARITARRAERELAAVRGDRLDALTSALRHPPTPLSLARDALAASVRRTDAILADEPWRDLRTRDVGRIADEMHDQASDRQRLRQEAAQQARRACETMRNGIGFLDRLASRLGVRTAAVRDFQSAETAAIRAEADRDEGRAGLRDEYRRARDVAPAIVRGRLADRDEWERNPRVLAARRQARGDDLVREAIAAGEPRVMLLAGHDLGLARDEILREAAERSWRTDALLRRGETLRQGLAEAAAARSPPTEALQPGWFLARR